MAAALLLSLLLTLLLLVSPSLSSHQLLLPLTHTLSHSHNATTSLHHLLKSSSHRSATSFHRHRSQVSLPLSPGSDYTLSLSLSSGVAVPLYMDTGSDLVWLPCSPFECILCENKPKPTTPPISFTSSSSPVPCDSPLCSAAHSSLPSSDLCAIAACPLDAIETSSCSSPCPNFYYAYGDGSLIASLRRTHITIASLKLQNFTFGCAHSALAEPVGVAGFGRGPLSLPAQLATLHPSLASGFSYCLVSHSFHPDRLLRPSPLILGRATSPDSPSSSPLSSQDSSFVFTPMLRNPKHPYFYSVGLEFISIGGVRIKSAPNLVSIDSKGNGGMVVDSGTTFTMIPSEMYSKLAKEFELQMAASGFRRAAETEAGMGMGPCYYYQGRRETKKRVPSMELGFLGNASVSLPRRNYFLGFESDGNRVGCLMVMDGGDDSEGGPAATLGNFQQQGMEVAYDLKARRVGFARRRCAAMWDELSRGR